MNRNMMRQAQRQAQKMQEQLLKVQEELDAARNELVQAQRSGNLERASELSYGVIPELEKKLH